MNSENSLELSALMMRAFRTHRMLMLVFDLEKNLVYEIPGQTDDLFRDPLPYETVRKMLPVFVAEEDRDTIVKLLSPESLADCRRENSSQYQRFTFVHDDGTRTIHCLELFALKEPDNMVVAFIRDITTLSADDLLRREHNIEQLLANNAGGVIFIDYVDGNAFPTRIGHAFQQMVGFTEEELLDLASHSSFGINEIIHPDDRDACERMERQLLESRDEVRLTFRVRCKDGSYSWVDGVGNYLHSPDTLDSYFVSFRKVDRFKELEESLSQHEERLQFVLDFSGIDYCDYDIQNDIVHMGEKAARRHGFPSGSIHHYLTALVETGAVHPDDIDKYLGMYQSVHDGAPFAECEVRVRDEVSGSYLWTKYRMRTFFEGHTPVRAVGSGIITDDYKRAESLYTQVCRQNDIAVWYIDINSRSIRNASKLEHFNPGQEGLCNIDQLQIENGVIYQDDVETYRTMYEKVWSGESEVSGSVRRWSEYHKKYVWYQYHFAATEWENGRPSLAIATARDISSEKEKEEAFLQAQQVQRWKDPKLIAYASANLTQGVIEDHSYKIEVQETIGETSLPFEFADRCTLFINQDDLPDISQLSSDALKASFAEGETRFLIEFWARFTDSPRQLYLRVECTLAERSTNGDLIAFFYISNHTDDRLRDSLVSDLSEHSFERTAALFCATNHLEPIKELTMSYSPYWDDATFDEGLRRFVNACLPESGREKYLEAVSLERIQKELETKPRYVAQYDVVDERGRLHRKEADFAYSDKEAGIILAIESDVAAYEGMRFLSEHDALTGLFNRAKFFAVARKLMSDHPDETFMFAQVDIDKFGLFNSSFGEEKGDELLKYMAYLLQDSLDQTGGYAAYGRVAADRFCFVVTGDPDVLTEKVEAANAMLHDWKSDYALFLSCGVYVVTDPSTRVEEASAKAAFAAKSCKDDCERSVVFFDSKEEDKEKEEVLITNEMQRALDEEQFEVYLQAKYMIAGEVPCGAEALVRWKHPERGMISPGEFIPIFERNAFISQLDNYMWNHVAALLSKWLKEGLDPAPVSVNVSRVSMFNPNLVDVFTDIIERYDIPANLMELEVTESSYMSNPEMMKKTIAELRDAGFVILMDDFGSGYSSLNTLKDIPVDILKIDMAFLPKGTNEKPAEIIIASVIRMAQWLGMHVIMEGVETEQEHDFLESVGCDFIQGYYYARPICAQEYEDTYVRSTPEIVKHERTLKVDDSPRKTILVTDDSLIIRKTLAGILGKEFDVVTAASAEDAIGILNANPHAIDLMIIDYVMEPMTGMDLLQYCTDSPELASIPKFMLTADSNPDTHLKALKLGVSGFFAKPIDSSVILTYCERQLMTPST